MNTLRLWCLMSVSSAPSLRSSILVVVLCLAIWCGLDWLYAQPDPQFFLANTPLLAWYALAILSLAALLGWRAKPRPAFAATFALAVGSIPVPLAVAALAANYLTIGWLWVLIACATLYGLIYFARGLRSLTGQSQRVTALCGILFIGAFSAATDALDVIPDFWAMPELDAPQASTDGALAE